MPQHLRQSRNHQKKSGRVQMWLVIGILTYFAIQIWDPFWQADLNLASDLQDTEEQTFLIEKGQGAGTVAYNLEELDLIVSSKSFLRALEKQDLDRSLNYGEYTISPSMTLQEVIDNLIDESSGSSVVTFLEGWTIEEMDQKLVDSGLIESGEFTACTQTCSFDFAFLSAEETGDPNAYEQSLEGYLFPDTYFVNPGDFTVEAFIVQLLSTFELRFLTLLDEPNSSGATQLTSEMISALETESGRSFNEIVNVAAMVEKEVRTEGDLEIVAGIIWKRLDAGWTLGIDATLLYVQEDNVLTASDLAQETPYNTRLYTGLPPTPISNPSLDSLRAALFAEKSNYWFYLTTLDTGEVIYAETNAQHEANKWEYL
jgi:UPF0755 protein